MSASTDLIPGRIQYVVVCGIDLTGLLDRELLPRLLSARASGDMWVRLSAYFATERGARSDSEAISTRRAQSLASAGKAVLSAAFCHRHDGLVHHEDLDPGRHPVALRVTRGGALTAQFRFDLAGDVPCEQAIRTVTALRARCAEILSEHVRTTLATPAALNGMFDLGPGPSAPGTADAVSTYSLLVVEHFRIADGEMVTPARVVISPEFGGLINHAAWYRAYGAKHGEIIQAKEIGYREDELYVADRTCLAIVNDRYWVDDAFRSYLEDVVVLLEHYVSRALVLRGLLRTTSANRIGESRLTTLSLLLDLRTVLDAVEQALTSRETIDQGFTRNLARHIGDELELPDLIALLEKRCSNLLQRVELEDAISSAGRSVKLARWNNALQTTALVVALVALAVSILF